jgi:hypothetical protein
LNRKKRLSDKNCTSIIHAKFAKYAKFCLVDDSRGDKVKVESEEWRSNAF